MTQAALKEFSATAKLPSNKASPTPSLKLLQRFQRLLIGKIYLKNVECQDAAETLLMKYLDCFSFHVIATLNAAYDISLINSKNLTCVMQILKNDIIGK